MNDNVRAGQDRSHTVQARKTYAMTIAILLGVSLGVIAAVNRGHILDKLAMILSIIGISMPGFWIALNLVIQFSVKSGAFPSVGYAAVDEYGIGVTLWYLTLPAVAMGLQRSASIARVTRSSMLDVLGEDYIRTARAKGLRERSVIGLHALKNAANPILTQIGISVAHLNGRHGCDGEAVQHPRAGTAGL